MWTARTRITLIAGIGAFNRANPPETNFFVATGVPFALEPYRGGFLVTDGHLNRVLHVSLDGEITELIAFSNIVPTGLAVSGNTVYMAQAGPIPHLPENGRVVAFGPKSTSATVVASGARLLVDVEFGRGRTLFALSQGVWAGVQEGDPALPNTGALVRVNGDGSFTVVTGALDRPISLEFIGDTAYVVTLTGEIWTIAAPPVRPSAYGVEDSAGNSNPHAQSYLTNRRYDFVFAEITGAVGNAPRSTTLPSLMTELMRR